MRRVPAWIACASLAAGFAVVFAGPATACSGLVSASGECLYQLPQPGQTAMEHEAPRAPDPWRSCLAAGEVSEGCPAFDFHRAKFKKTEDAIAKQKMSIIVWQAARAAFRCEDETFGRFEKLVETNFSGVDNADLDRTLPVLADMHAYIEETC
ncbi:MAG: hypothetical protein AAF503_11820 [Pseudomonadota bacterium]